MSGSEVREGRQEFESGFGVPTLNCSSFPKMILLQANGLRLMLKPTLLLPVEHRAGVLESSFVAEVKSDLMGEQTILCGVLQTGSIFKLQ